MGLSRRQIRALRRDVNVTNIRTRTRNGRELSYIEGNHALSEANRIFGFDGWDRETTEAKCILARENRGNFTAVYACKVTITVRAGGTTITRDGHGCGEGAGTSPSEVHELALKSAETDATKRALATFGKPFGLALHNGQTRREAESSAPGGLNGGPKTRPEPIASSTNNATQGLDKSQLRFPTARRVRDKEHLRFVGSQPCLLCTKTPSDPHHLRFAQPRALGSKVSDEYTVPLCRAHHRQLHHSGNERAWWHDMGIEPLEIAKILWQDSKRRQRDIPNEQITQPSN